MLNLQTENILGFNHSSALSSPIDDEKEQIKSFLNEERCVLVVLLLDKTDLHRRQVPLTDGQQVLIGREHPQDVSELLKRSSTWCTLGIAWSRNGTEVQDARSLSQALGKVPNHQLLLFKKGLVGPQTLNKDLGIPQERVYYIWNEEKKDTMRKKVYRQCPSIGQPKNPGLKLTSICSPGKGCRSNVASIKHCPSPVKNQVQ